MLGQIINSILSQQRLGSKINDKTCEATQKNLLGANEVSVQSSPRP